MRLRLALPTLIASLSLHAGAAAWFLPNDMKPESAGGQQAAVLEIGTEAFDALMAGAETLEAEQMETAQAEAIGEIAPEPVEAREIESDLTAEAEMIPARPDAPDNNVPESEVVENVLMAVESLPSTPIQILQADQGEILASIDPVREITAEPEIPVPAPAPKRPEIKQQKPAKKAAQKPKPKVEKPSAEKKAAAKKTAKPATKKAASKNTGKSGKKVKKSGSGGKSSASAKRGASGSKTAKTNRNKGNAASSNYPGKVFAKISRTRRKSAGGSGTARVSFQISSGGGLASIRLAKSSGNTRVDRAAVAHVKRAAPFPKPPAGAKRSFVIPIEFRR